MQTQFDDDSYFTSKLVVDTADHFSQDTSSATWPFQFKVKHPARSPNGVSGKNSNANPLGIWGGPTPERLTYLILPIYHFVRIVREREELEIGFDTSSHRMPTISESQVNLYPWFTSVWF
jgi:hypothetical protein